jgi:hypothetical protein
VTAGGLAFIAGTFDPFIRAFDVRTGKEIWKAQLPASGNATPMTYSIKGRQYLVIAAGGHPKITEEALSDALIAFAVTSYPVTDPNLGSKSRYLWRAAAGMEMATSGVFREIFPTSASSTHPSSGAIQKGASRSHCSSDGKAGGH